MKPAVPSLPVFALTLCACLAACGPRGAFPSLQPRAGEAPRIIEAPGAGLVPELAPEQRQGLKADLAREEAALSDADAEVRRAGAELDRALARARGQARGTEAWSDAQMALSRLDVARAPLGEIEARLTPLLRIVDDLDSQDPDRLAVESLAAAANRAANDAERRVRAAGEALAR
jgi:hypothetical protein